MLRKMLFGAVALTGLTFIGGTSTADAGWRRAYRQGYYAPYNGGYYYAPPRRVFRPRIYTAPVYSYGAPVYYNNAYNYGPGYYGPGSYGPGIGIQTPGFGLYIR